jgi:hypothetical protein
MTKTLPTLILTLATLAITFIEGGTYADWVRVGLLGIGAVLTGKVAITVVEYARIIKRSGSRALPVHVVLIGTSYMILILVASIDTARNIGQDMGMVWKLPMRCVAFVIGIISLRAMKMHLNYERRVSSEMEGTLIVCYQCGSHYASTYCARCGAKQLNHLTSPTGEKVL